MQKCLVYQEGPSIFAQGISFACSLCAQSSTKVVTPGCGVGIGDFLLLYLSLCLEAIEYYSKNPWPLENPQCGGPCGLRTHRPQAE